MFLNKSSRNCFIIHEQVILHIFTKQFLQNSSLWQWYAFVIARKAFGSTLGNHFSISLSLFSWLSQRLPGRSRAIVFSKHTLAGRQETVGRWQVRRISRMFQSRHIVFGKLLLTTNDRCAGALSCRRSPLYRAHLSGRFLPTGS
jgi:hypothetical protein